MHLLICHYLFCFVQCSDRLSYTTATSFISEDVNFKAADVRDQCIIANSINRVIHHNVNSDQLDRHKHDPTTALSYDSVVSSNANNSRNHLVDRQLSELASSSETKHCGGDAQRFSVNFAKAKSILSSYREGFCGDVGRTDLKNDGVGWSKPLGSSSRVGWGRLDDAQCNGFLTTDPATETWFYKDPNGQIQGQVSDFRHRSHDHVLC